MADDEVLGGPIPDKMREAVYSRDNLACRMCGKGVLGDFGAGIHHCLFGYSKGHGPGTGGARVHRVDEMVLLCGRCHRRAHADKFTWQDLLLEVIKRPGVTAFQLRRWARRRTGTTQARRY